MRMRLCGTGTGMAGRLGEVMDEGLGEGMKEGLGQRMGMKTGTAPVVEPT